MNRKKPGNSKHKPVRPAPVAKTRSRPEPGTRMSVLLANPDYLMEGFAEKRCKYVGELQGIATSADLNDRGFLLSTLDAQRNVGQLPWQLGLENEVSLTISAYNLKIIREDRAGTVLQRVPIHQIACCCYVNDDDHHLLFIRAGDASRPCCPVHVLLLGKRADAEEVCSILQQAFQLVYTEATMQQLNESITAGEGGMGQGSSLRREQKRSQKPSKGPSTAASPSGGGGVEGDEIEEEEEEEEEEEGMTAEELVQKYMERLHKLLDFKELREFATLLKRYRDDLPVREFLSKLKELYGPQRSFLIPDMRSFIPEEDRAYFEAFLIENNLPVNQSGSSTRAKPHPPPQGKAMGGAGVKEESGKVGGGEGRREGEGEGRGRRAKKHVGHIADVDKFLADIDSQMDSMLDSTNF